MEFYFLLEDCFLLNIWIKFLAALAAILIATGWKLANPKIFKDLFSKSKYQYIPFIFTVIAVVFTNLLTGVLAGLAVSITFILIGNLKNSYYFKEHAEQPDKVVSITLAEEVDRKSVV